MLYELFITSECNRRCSFCKIPKTTFLASKEQILRFFNFIKEHETNDYEVLIFGGEPLLDIETLDYAISLFNDDKHCKIRLTTNGDLYKKWTNEKSIRRIDSLTISAYDIFIDVKKYEDMISYFRTFNSNLTITYTFSQDDIGKVFDYVNICKRLNIAYKVVTSHSAVSWKSIDIRELYAKISSYVEFLLNDMYLKFVNENTYELDSDLNALFKRLILNIMFEDDLPDHWCICGNKKSFYNGLFIGECILLKDKNIKLDVPEKCKKCKFRKTCSHSCFYEIKDCVEEHLCTIEYAKIDTILKFIRNHCQEIGFKRLVKQIV